MSAARVAVFLAMAGLVACKGAEGAGGGSGGAQYRLEAPAVSLAPSAKGEAVVRFLPGEGLHWNDEFPARLKVVDAGPLAADKTDFSLGAGDFKADGGAGVLKVPVTAKAAGDGTLKATADFSMCTAKECRIFKGIAVEVPVHVR